ncbi:MAG: tetratricopeptide repeat protein [Thermoleophilaceae bacterium]|nr:tetratricopeptide repeat protein [Thermoleophilaceae bacterium]
MIRDVTEATWQTDVIERSRELPVVVDFWAEWCGPCRQLTPALEAAAGRHDGEIDLAKVDVDSNQGLSQSFGIQGIPAVKAFKDGEVASEFTGALPPAKVEEFFAGLLPPVSDGVKEQARELLARGDNAEARELLADLPNDFEAVGLAARAELAERGDDLGAAWTAWDAGEFGTALDQLQDAFAAADDDEQRDLVRRAMVAIFTELGPGHELAREHRRRLSAAMF